MADLGLTQFNQIFPMLIRKYDNLIIDQNANERDKINQIINKLNALGKLSNDVVKNWNVVYNWAMNDGLSTDVSNKLETMKTNGELTTILQGIFNSLTGDMTTLHTTARDTLVNSINEVDDLAKSNQTKLGDLTTLQTTDKDTIVHAINDNVSALAHIVQCDINNFPVISPEVDDTARLQRAINSLQGKAGNVLLQAVTYTISSTLVIPENVGLQGIMTGRNVQDYSTLWGTVLKWNGATNGTMVKFDNNLHVVYNGKLMNVGFDANSIAGVKCVDLTNADYTTISFCAFRKMDIGIYANGMSYWNRILFSHIEKYTTAGIWIQNSSNAYIICGNTFNSDIHPSIGIYVKDSNGVEIYLNQFELGMNGDEYVTIDGSFNARGTSINGNRFESKWSYDSGQTACYSVHIKSGVEDTILNSNQFYSQETFNTVTYTNDSYNIKDEGKNTLYDGLYSGKNYVHNGKLRQINSTFPYWKNYTSYTSLSVDATTGDTIVNVNNSTSQYPFVYQMFDASLLRGKTLYLSTKIKADNITTVPKIEAFCYQGGNGTIANQGTYVGGTANSLYKSGEYVTIYNSFTVPNTTDFIFVNVNVNGNNSTTPSNNNIYIHYIALADKKVMELGDSIERLDTNKLPSFVTSARPNNPIVGLHGIDTTLNKIIWFDGTSWRDAMGNVV